MRRLAGNFPQVSLQLATLICAGFLENRILPRAESHMLILQISQALCVVLEGWRGIAVLTVSGGRAPVELGIQVVLRPASLRAERRIQDALRLLIALSPLESGPIIVGVIVMTGIEAMLQPSGFRVCVLARIGDTAGSPLLGQFEGVELLEAGRSLAQHGERVL